jgi:hypothetical protein
MVCVCANREGYAEPMRKWSRDPHEGIRVCILVVTTKWTGQIQAGRGWRLMGLGVHVGDRAHQQKTNLTGLDLVGWFLGGQKSTRAGQFFTEIFSCF